MGYLAWMLGEIRTLDDHKVTVAQGNPERPFHKDSQAYQDNLGTGRSLESDRFLGQDTRGEVDLDEVGPNSVDHSVDRYMVDTQDSRIDHHRAYPASLGLVVDPNHGPVVFHLARTSSLR